MTWELLDRPGETPRSFSVSSDGALDLLAAAVEQANAAGLPWSERPVELRPSQELVKLVRLSQGELVMEGAGVGA